MGETGLEGEDVLKGTIQLAKGLTKGKWGT